MTATAVYVIGPPGAGKTTAVAEYIGLHRDRMPAVKTGYRGLWVEPLVDRNTGIVDGLHLGRRRPGGFGGTDALAMNVHPHALAWAANADLPDLVVGEGQRLATAAFLTTLHARTDLTVVYLYADDQTLDERCEARGSSQNSAWRKGSATKALRTADRAAEAGIRVVRVNAAGDTSLDAWMAAF